MQKVLKYPRYFIRYCILKTKLGPFWIKMAAILQCIHSWRHQLIENKFIIFCSLQNIDIYAKSICKSPLVYKILHFIDKLAAILNFNTSWRHQLNESYFIVLITPENMGVAEEIFSVSQLVCEICALESPKWRPFWIL